MTTTRPEGDGASARVRFPSQRAWRLRNPEKRRVHIAVRGAEKRGELIRQPCQVCGDPKADGHHENYAKPLDVTWLCRKHNKERHKQMRKERP